VLDHDERVLAKTDQERANTISNLQLAIPKHQVPTNERLAIGDWWLKIDANWHGFDNDKDGSTV
jgi:hypothetical protein